MADLKDLSHIMGRIHGAKLTLSGLGHNFWLECTGDLTCAFLNCILKTLFRDTPLARFRWCARCQVPAPGTWIFRCQVLCVRWHERWASGVSLKRAFKMQFRNAYFKSLVHSSQKLWPKPDWGNFAPCSALKNRWFPELNEGAIFEQNTVSKICLSIKM